MSLLSQDLRLAVRGLVRSPLFAIVAILSLALGIGANTAIFGAINGLLLKPVQAAHPDRLVAIFTSDFSGPLYGGSSYADALDFARDEPIGDVVLPGAAVLRRNRRPEQAELAHLAEDLGVGFFISERLQHPRPELLLTIRIRRIAHHALVLRELLVKEQRVAPAELRFGLSFGGVHCGVRPYFWGHCMRSRMTARPWPTPMQRDTAA